MFKVNERVMIADYPESELVGREGIVTMINRHFVEVLVDGTKAARLFRHGEIDKLEDYR